METFCKTLHLIGNAAYEPKMPFFAYRLRYQLGAKFYNFRSSLMIFRLGNLFGNCLSH